MPRCLAVRIATALLMGVWASFMAAPRLRAQEAGAEVETLPNLVFAQSGGHELALDLFRPRERTELLPAIVCIHGGGWWKGERADHAGLARALAARGYVTVTISYRLSGEAPFPAQIHDAKAAVRWLRSHAADYGIDPTRIGATGHSAGGHLAALLATSGGVAALEGDEGPAGDSRVQAVVGMGAQADLEAEHIRTNNTNTEKLPMWVSFLGGAYVDVPDRYRAASPVTYLDAGDPPLAFITGEKDGISTRAEEVRRRLMALGIPTRLTVIGEAGHGIFQRSEWVTQVVDAAVKFFDLHLKQGGRPRVAASDDTLCAALFEKGTRWQTIGGGYAGCEGPQWIMEAGEPALLYAAQHDFFVFKWTERAGLRVWRGDSPEATAFRPDGRGGFFVVEQTTRRVVRWDQTAQVTEILAERYEGQRLNRPNDVVVRSDGTLWFSDPDFLFKQRTQDVKELPGQFIFRLDPATKALRAVVSDLKLPNGLAFSPDESQFYFTDTAGDEIFRALLGSDGLPGPRETFARIPAKGIDGLAFDAAGRLWCAAMDGVHVFDGNGKDLGTLTFPFKPTAIAFQGGERPQVCVTTREAAFVALLKR